MPTMQEEPGWCCLCFSFSSLSSALACTGAFPCVKSCGTLVTGCMLWFPLAMAVVPFTSLFTMASRVNIRIMRFWKLMNPSFPMSLLSLLFFVICLAFTSGMPPPMNVQREVGFLWQALRIVLVGFDCLQPAYTECEQNRQLPEFSGRAIPLITQKVGEIMGPDFALPRIGEPTRDAATLLQQQLGDEQTSTAMARWVIGQTPIAILLAEHFKRENIIGIYRQGVNGNNYLLTLRHNYSGLMVSHILVAIVGAKLKDARGTCRIFTDRVPNHNPKRKGRGGRKGKGKGRGRGRSRPPGRRQPSPGPTESESCRQAVLRGGWLGAAAAANNLAAIHFLPHGSPRRLDAIFLNKAAAVCFRKYHVHDARSPFASSGCFFGCLLSVSFVPSCKNPKFCLLWPSNRVLLFW